MNQECDVLVIFTGQKNFMARWIFFWRQQQQTEEKKKKIVQAPQLFTRVQVSLILKGAGQKPSSNSNLR